MTFMIILLALILERFFHWHHMRHWHWFSNYERWLSTRLSSFPAVLVLLIILVPPLVVVGLLQYALADWWWGIFEFIFSTIVLLYCLGPDNLWVQTYGCIRELNKQDPQAIDYVQKAFGFAATDNSSAFHESFVRAIFLASHQRIFGVVFWFVLLGPIGAVFYRLIEGISRLMLTGSTFAGQIKGLLDWIPVRLLALLFALGGHFTAVLPCLKRDALKGPRNNDQFLAMCGMAALDVDHLPESMNVEQEALALIDRAFVIGLVILAIAVLLG